MADETTMRLGDAELHAETADGYFGPRYEDVVGAEDSTSLLEAVDGMMARIAALVSSSAKSESTDTISSLKTKCNSLLSALAPEDE